MGLILTNREVKNGILEPITIQYNEKKEIIWKTDEYLEIGFSSREPEARLLSNLARYKFTFFGVQAESLEGVIQSLKFEDESIRELCYGYYGRDAWDQRGMKPYEWQKTGILHTPVGKIDRYSENYQNFLDTMYFMIYDDNAKYRLNLSDTESLKLDHVLKGEDDVKRTTLTRTEYISRLYALRYCAQNQIRDEHEVKKILVKVRAELN